MASYSTPNEVAKLYQSLPVDGIAKTIRVLDILPDRDAEEIRTQLRVVRLFSDADYEALSYTWV